MTGNGSSRSPSYDVREPDPRYDGNLARLRWLEWWVDWALKNCKLPAVGNT
jgi:hypothetical protein